MSVPQVKDRPASALRAVFAGIGSLLTGKSAKDKSGKDKPRTKPAAEAPADAQAPAPKAETPETAAKPETAAEPVAVAAEPVAVTAEPVAVAEPEVIAAAEAVAEPEVTVAAVAVAAEPAAEPEKAAEPAPIVAEAAAKAAGELPLANYDELTVASLRARLRNLSNDDLVQLKEYEQAHQNRPEVIKMFQNRLIKMTSGLPKLEA